MQRIAVLGANGQVGRAWVAQLGDRAIALTRNEVNLAKPESLAAALDALQPDAVVNASAYTAVDKAESDAALATTINAESPGVIARWCAAQGIPLIHYSTDYVFDGTGEKPWQETDSAAPLGVYGASKLAGEQAVAEAGGKYLIFRASWLYDAVGKNFLNTMLRLGAEREELRVVADQIGAPTYVPDLTAISLQALEKTVVMEAFPSGLYHLSHTGSISWHGFAEAIFAAARERGEELVVQQVEAILLGISHPATRPLNSRLNCSKFHTVFGLVLPKWEQGLARAMEAKYALETAQ